MAMQDTLRVRLKEIDHALPLSNVRTLDHWLGNSASRPRFQSTLFAVFSGLAYCSPESGSTASSHTRWRYGKPGTVSASRSELHAVTSCA
jgi:hypothetical protein